MVPTPTSSPNPDLLNAYQAGPSSASGSRINSPLLPSSPLPGDYSLRRPASQGRLAKFLLPGRSRSSSVASTDSATIAVNNEEVVSGRSTPEQRRRSGKAAAASLLANDSRYKKFAAQVERALQSFESVNEWADFISFLSRLLKTLQAPNPPFHEIPKKLLISKRLAQCLNPALPSGVHQRALDVYSYIFGVIGVEGLQRDLLIWSSGLFPFFQFASTSVRPHILKVYERFYLPLGPYLRPATKALMLALLPGMEEETGDFFDTVLSLLDRLSESVSPDFFLSNLFLLLISSQSSRLAALNYLSRRLLKPPDAQSELQSGLIIRGVAAVLEDDNALVRRYGLDLLLRIVRMDEPLFSNAEREDQDLLIRAVSAVLLQKDISLSRRVFTWYLGTSEDQSEQVKYFETQGVSKLTKVLTEDMNKEEDQQPYKIMLALMDKLEIGSVLSGNVVIPALAALKASSRNGDPDMELPVTVTAIYESIEPVVFWRLLFNLISKDYNTQNLELITMVLNSLHQPDEELTSIFLPALLQYCLSTQPTISLEGPSQARTQAQILQVCVTLLRQIPSSQFTKSSAIFPQHTSPTLFERIIDGSHDLKPYLPDLLPSIVSQIFSLFAEVSKDDDEKAILLCLAMISTLLEYEPPSLEAVQMDNISSSLLSLITSSRKFGVVQSVSDIFLQASSIPMLQDEVNLATSDITKQIMDALLYFLRDGCSAYHVRAVELLWEYNQRAEMYTLENALCARFSDQVKRTTAMQEFGTLWRLTDDSILPGEIFFTPVFIILDAVKSNDPNTQGLGETWLRVNLRSYFRLLDPILTRLGSPSSTSGDLGLQAHMLDSLATLLRFGGQTLCKACQITDLAKSAHPEIVKRADVKVYVNLMLKLLTNLLALGPKKDLTGARQLLHVQNSALEVLQLLVSFGAVPASAVEQLQLALIRKTEQSIKTVELSLQSKLLHLLHATMSGVEKTVKGHHRRSSSITEKLAPTTDMDEEINKLVETGLSSSDCTPVLQHWVDFILMTANHFQTRRDLLERTASCINDGLESQMGVLKTAFEGNVEDLNISELEPIMLLSALEKIMMLLLSRHNDRKSEDSMRPSEGGSSIFGLLPTVFTVEGPASEAKPADSQWLDDALHVLLLIWTITAVSESPTDNSSHMSNPSMIQIYTRVRLRARKVLEKIFKAQPTAVMAGFIRAWAKNLPNLEDAAIFDAVDGLTSSAQKVVEMIGEGLVGRAKHHGSEAVYLAFLEAYIQRLEAPIAVQVWVTSFNLAKDLSSAAHTPVAKGQLYSMLKCLTTLGKIVATTSALEDKRLRRDLQESYARLLDTVILNISKLDGSIWTRDEKLLNGDLEIGGNVQINRFVAEELVPNLRILLLENDRISAACSSIATGLLNTPFRQHRIEPSLLAIIHSMTAIPAAGRSWRPLVGAAYDDSKFFRIDIPEAELWQPLINSLFDTDKDRFVDLLSRIQAGPSANIFTNREQEMILRSLNLRRLSFILLSADHNHYLTQLPSIQEKLVDILRNDVVSPKVHSEVYLCLRVLTCRISAQHLTNFWPVILAELLKNLENTMDDPPADGSEELLLVLAACKFLDLLLVIQSEDFQVHQWMFVTDTTDAALPPETSDPESMLDRLNEILSEHAFTLENGSVLEWEEYDGEQPRKPRLSHLRIISSLRILQPFFARASMDTFEGVYAGKGVDWEAVEQGLKSEIFEGKDN